MMQAPLFGLILAGGESLRMGEDKSAIRYHGVPQARHLAQLLTPYTERVLVSVRAAQCQAVHLQGLETVRDHYAPRSALNGIVSAMRAFPGTSWLVVAVDMPYITPGAIETLISARNAAAGATCFESPAKGGPDPLFAVWEADRFAALEALLEAEGHTCPRRALKALGAHVLKNAVAAEILHNVNTPSERDALTRHAS